MQVPPGTAGGMRPSGTWPQQPPGAPTVTIATYTDYADAQRAVDYLSDRGFPVQHVSIVGTGLRLEEQVLGRLTIGRAALSGAGAGAWVGLLVGLLLGLFAVGAWLGVVVTAVVLGAVWGAILGAVAQGLLRGMRDFTSRSRLQAAEYALHVTQPFADEARHVLNRANWEQANIKR
jgi:ABC-type branched-subunit amino acid transport system permease subunit